MTTRLRTLLVGGLKLGLSGALICAIAWCFVAFDTPGGDVDDAEAHIFALEEFAPRTKNQRFMSILRDFELEKPRAYNWNGNHLYYSMGSTDLTPVQFLSQFQHALVEKGINKKVHTRILPAMTEKAEQAPPDKRELAMRKSARDHFERVDDFFAGGLVPIHRDPNHVAMAGAISKNDADGALDFALEMFEEKQPLEETVGQMRYVEAWRGPGDDNTTIAAMWSDDELEINKFAPDSRRSDLAVDPNVPVCLGCKRLMRFAGEGDESAYATTVFVGRQTVAQVVDFYDRALRSRGWKLSEASQTERLLSRNGIVPPSSAQLTSFAKHGRFITVMAYPIDAGQTQVHVFESP